ncbi:MAG TPA: sulfite exporter TauE/SafE family protein, partial [Armatimonadetes bacterium]|nr:sulfite exporter TauE/SafE family protein [Armatimonadota bacterium]
MAEVNLGLLPELIALGLAVGVISGLFGVGGGFLLTPMLNVIFGLPYNIAVGTGIFVTLGTSIVGAIRHWRLGNVDLKLGLLMLTGGIPGVLGGVRLVEALEQAGEVKLLGGRMSAVDFVLSLVFLLLLGLVGLFSLFESRRALCKG